MLFDQTWDLINEYAGAIGLNVSGCDAYINYVMESEDSEKSRISLIVCVPVCWYSWFIYILDQRLNQYNLTPSYQVENWHFKVKACTVNWAGRSSNSSCDRKFILNNPETSSIDPPSNASDFSSSPFEMPALHLAPPPLLFGPHPIVHKYESLLERLGTHSQPDFRMGYNPTLWKARGLLEQSRTPKVFCHTIY